MGASQSFTRFAKWTSRASGHPATFGLALVVIAVWAITGPLFHFSDTWQLVINTGTTIVTFLMVFLIQNTQNRDAVAMQIKLDELIRALKGAHNQMVDLEELTEEELDRLKAEYARLAREARANGHAKVEAPQADSGKVRASGKAATNASTAAGSS